ncbi:jg21030 [Pararge aegeria aegeria]|uniref:Jg21030 protein n=1 Tax=Pararge aegeria aegeria TaxID=348720 RepID=A0A8S4RQF4_9NEOP|nr:jg21030 [Pararge aegeria aegeria]
MDNKELTVLTLLDFSNAFNTVDYDILLSLLRSINISPSVLEWFRSYLSRQQRIRIEESSSSWCDVAAGVPQGGVLSPLLFAIFINSITHRISSLYHMYADDIQIYRHSTLGNLGPTVSAVNSDLSNISEWSRQYGLKVNPVKSQAIIIGSPGLGVRVDWQNLPPVVYNGVTIPYCDTVKDLGLHLDKQLSWSVHVNVLSRRMFATIRSLRRLRSVLPIPTKVMLAHSLILSILDYADTSYLNLTEDQLNKLERLQNLAIRFIFGLRKYDHVSEFRLKLKWLPIRRRRDLHVLSLLYCVLFNPKTPSYLKEKFNFLGVQSDIRSCRTLTLSMPFHKTKFYKHSFIVQATELWNALPISIRQSRSLDIFKNAVKAHYLEQ